ncbi:hypothetical protein [Mesorhizobium sp. KR9-304]
MNRLMLALAVIAAIVGLLGLASTTAADARAIASASSHQGELP